MTREDEAFRHARAALDHCTWTIESLRRRVGDAENAGSRQQRLALRGVLYDLEKRRDFLRTLHTGMASCPANAFAGCWRAFQAAYDDFLEVARAGRRELDLAGWQDLVHAPCGDDSTRR